MNITPLDIRKQEFRKALRGYDPVEVQAFLDMIADVYEKTSRELISIQERAETLEVEIGRFRNLERTLQETLVTAQQASEDTRENAKKEGDLIIKEAQIVAERAIEQARGQVGRIKAEFASLKSQRDTFIARFKGLLEAQTELLKGIRSDETRESKHEGNTNKPSKDPGGPSTPEEEDETISTASSGG